MIRDGIAGFGKIGQIRASELEKNENSKVVAVFDVNKPDSLDNDIKFIESYKELLNQDIDARNFKSNATCC